MRESAIEALLVPVCTSAGGRCYKWVSPGNSGVPDRIVFLPGGKVIFVELKTETGRTSASRTGRSAHCAAWARRSGFYMVGTR